MRPHKDVAEMLAVIREGVNLIAPKYEKAVEEMDGGDKEESASTFICRLRFRSFQMYE